jgi:hypothetical protein
MEQTATIIKKSGIFDRVDKLYGDLSAVSGGAPAAEGGETTPPEEGGFGGGDIGGGAFGSETTPPAGGTEPASPEPAAEPKTESMRKAENLLLEQTNKKYEEKVKKYQNIYLKRLMESLEKNENVFNLDSVEKDTDTLNSKITEMTKEIDNLIK